MSRTIMFGPRQVTMVSKVPVTSAVLYAAVWNDGSMSWAEATGVTQARLIHTFQRKESPTSVYKEAGNKWWKS